MTRTSDTPSEPQMTDLLGPNQIQWLDSHGWNQKAREIAQFHGRAAIHLTERLDRIAERRRP